MRVLLSIKPEFVERIFDGTKKYEFRKSLFKRDDVTIVVVYASSPIKRVVGEFEISEIISEDVEALWKRTKDYSGVTEEYFNTYFFMREIANAIRIGKVVKYDQPKSLSDYNLIRAPQSFCYLPE